MIECHHHLPTEVSVGHSDLCCGVVHGVDTDVVDEFVRSSVVTDSDHRTTKVAHGRLDAVEEVENAAPADIVLRRDRSRFVQGGEAPIVLPVERREDREFDHRRGGVRAVGFVSRHDIERPGVVEPGDTRAEARVDARRVLHDSVCQILSIRDGRCSRSHESGENRPTLKPFADSTARRVIVFITRDSTIPRQSGPEKRSHPVTRPTHR